MSNDLPEKINNNKNYLVDSYFSKNSEIDKSLLLKNQICNEINSKKINNIFSINMNNKVEINKEDLKIKPFNESKYNIEQILINQEKNMIKCLSLNEALSNPNLFEENKDYIYDFHEYVSYLISNFEDLENDRINDTKSDEILNFESKKDSYTETYNSFMNLKKEILISEIDEIRNKFINEINSLKVNIENHYKNQTDTFEDNISFISKEINNLFDNENDFSKYSILEEINKCDNSEEISNKIRYYLNKLNNLKKDKNCNFINNLIKNVEKTNNNIHLKSDEYNLPKWFDYEMDDLYINFKNKIFEFNEKIKIDLNNHLNEIKFESKSKNTCMNRDINYDNSTGFKYLPTNKKVKLTYKKKINLNNTNKLNCIYKLTDNLLFCGFIDGLISCYDIDKNILIEEFKEKHFGEVTFLGMINLRLKGCNEYKPYLISGGDSNECLIKIWDLKHNIPFFNLKGHKNSIISGLDLENNKLASVSLEGSIIFWDILNSQFIYQLELNKIVSNVKLSVDKSKIICGTNNNSIVIAFYNKNYNLKNNSYPLIIDKIVSLESIPVNIFQSQIDLKCLIVTLLNNKVKKIYLNSGKLEKLDLETYPFDSILLENYESLFDIDFKIVSIPNIVQNKNLSKLYQNEFKNCHLWNPRIQLLKLKDEEENNKYELIANENGNINIYNIN